MNQALHQYSQQFSARIPKTKVAGISDIVGTETNESYC